MIPILFFQCSADHRDLHSFPTRRSSDLWHHWGCDWHHHYAVHDHGRYYSTSRTFYNRDKFYRGEATRGMYNRPERAPEPFAGSHGAARGYAEAAGQSAALLGAFDADRQMARREAEARGKRDAT